MENVVSGRRQFKPVSALLSTLTAALIVLIIAAISVPNLLRSRMASDQARQAAQANQQKLSEQDAGTMPAVRQVVQTGNLQLTVTDPAATEEQIAAIAQRVGGFVESSELFHSGNQIPGGQITIRVPAVAFDSTRAEIGRLAKRVDSETVHSSDVTAQFVDMQATLRNYRAEEAQYLAIMRGARNVRETLEVAQRLSDVRGRIERAQAQVNLMSRQVEMASLAISLRAEAALPPAGLSWSPLRQLRTAWHDSLEGFADYIDAMLVVLFRIPLVLAWAFTVCALAALAWRMLRWIWRHWFATAGSQPLATSVSS